MLALHFTVPTMTKCYPCLNPDCQAEYVKNSSLKRHYAHNPACSIFVHNVSLDIQHFGQAASTQQPRTSVGLADSQQSSDNNAPVRQCSHAVDADVAVDASMLSGIGHPLLQLNPI